MDDDDDAPQLSAETFAALKEFYQEEDQREAMKNSAAPDEDIEAFSEDWNLSQFWYDRDTSEILAKECVRVAGAQGKIACISAPSAYIAIRKLFPAAKGNVIF